MKSEESHRPIVGNVYSLCFRNPVWIAAATPVDEVGIVAFWVLPLVGTDGYGCCVALPCSADWDGWTADDGGGGREAQHLVKFLCVMHWYRHRILVLWVEAGENLTEVHPRGNVVDTVLVVPFGSIVVYRFLPRPVTVAVKVLVSSSPSVWPPVEAQVSPHDIP